MGPGGIPNGQGKPIKSPNGVGGRTKKKKRTKFKYNGLEPCQGQLPKSRLGERPYGPLKSKKFQNLREKKKLKIENPKGI